MKRPIFVAAFAACLALGVSQSILARSSPQQAQQTEPGQKTQASQPMCPMLDAHSSMDQRAEAEHGMGFSQTETIHHFSLASSGGAIQVDAKRPDDTVNIGKIRMHLAHVAKMFSEGDFAIPMFVHDAVPPGVPEMKRLKDKITYVFQTTPSGGRVVISTADAGALAAIHDFLRFQIREHATGDSANIRP